MASDTDLFFILLNGANELSRKLFVENGDFYPVLFYFKEGKAISSTIFDEKFNINYVDDFLYQNIGNLVSYVVVVNDKKKSAFLVCSKLNNIRFDDMYIAYKYYDNQCFFSKELLTNDELLIWHKTDWKRL